MKQLRFFATAGDLRPVLSQVEQSMPLQYVPSESAGSSVEPIMSHDDLPSLGIASDESAVNCASFLVAPQTTSVQPRLIRLNTGESRVLIDQLQNPDTVVLTPGGVWNGDVVLYGTVGTTSDSQVAKELMKAFERGLKKHFKKVKAYWVGPEALTRLKEGQRLTIAVQSPTDFDLTIGN